MRENVVRTAGLRRAWRCEQRRRLRRISTIPSKSQFENATTMSRPGAVSPLAKRRTPTAKTHKSGDGIDEAATQSSLLNDVVNCSWMLRPLSARYRQQQQQQQQQQEQPSLSIAPEIAAPDVDMDIQEDDDEKRLVIVTSMAGIPRGPKRRRNPRKTWVAATISLRAKWKMIHTLLRPRPLHLARPHELPRS